MKEVIDSIAILMIGLLMVLNSLDIQENKKEIEALKEVSDEYSLFFRCS